MNLRKHFNKHGHKSLPEVEVPEDVRLDMFSEENPDIGFFNIIDEEQIALGGSEFYIYKVETDANHDELYEEDRLKKYATKVLVRGHYTPIPVGEELSEFGIKLTNDQTFTFNKSYLDTQLHRPMEAGDVIQPRFQNIVFEVHEVQEQGFAGYGVYHYAVTASVRRDLESLITDTIG